MMILKQVQVHSKNLADTYFANISTINTAGILDDRQIHEHRLKYSQACLKDHLSYVFRFY